VNRKWIVVLVVLVFFIGVRTIYIFQHEEETTTASKTYTPPPDVTVTRPDKTPRQRVFIEEEPRQTQARERMVEYQMKARGITDQTVLHAMSVVQRHEFIPAEVRDSAYEDHPLPIGHGQTISQPYIVALMTQELGLNPSDRVLEVGTGSGYQAAVLAEIVDEVYTMEIIQPLAERGGKTLERLGYSNVQVKHGDGYFGWPEEAPFNAIIITAAVDHIPRPLVDQLADGGRLILPLGSTRYHQTLTVVEKKDGELKTRYVTGVVFVPMTGEALKR
jgi:protein-L-isoaspartate(D-aspartate) O-methyltransferase